MRRKSPWFAVLIVAVLVYALFGAHIRAAYLTTLLLLELPTPEVDGVIASRLPDPQVTHVTFEAAGKVIVADVYRPPDGGPHPGIVLNHGVSARGMNDARLINFADALARCGYVALVPEFVNLKEFRVRSTDVAEIVGAYRYLEQLPDVDPARVGLFGFSYAGGLAALAANEPSIADRVRFCFMLGSYYDLSSIAIYATTGYYREGGEWVYMAPRHTGKWALLKNMLEMVDSDSDRELLARIADAKLDDDGRDVSATASLLGPEGAVLFDFMTNTDPDRAADIFESLSPRILEFFEALSLRGNIDDVTAHLIVVHGRDDNLMPYTESILLAENAPPGATVDLKILESFQHVDLEFSWEGGPAEWIETIAEVGRVYSVAHALIAQGNL